MSGKHVVIIGGGVIGLCAAVFARERGHRVTVVERGGPAHDSCSLGNMGMVVPSHFTPLAAPGMVAMGLRMMWDAESPFYVKPRLSAELVAWAWRFWRASNVEQVCRAAPLLRDLSLESRRLFEEFAGRRGLEFGLVRRGLLMLCKTEQALREESHTGGVARELGIPAETLDAEQVARLDPGARVDVAGAVYFPKDCHLSPERFVAALTRLAEESGVEFRWETEIARWRTSGGRVVAAGEVAGDEFVIAGGSWSSLLARELGLSLPMQAGKGYSLTLPQPRQLPQLCSILTEARVAVTPMPGTAGGTGALRFGGTMEIAGLDESVNPARVRGIVKSAVRYFPEFTAEDFRGVPVWRGLRPCSPDGLPYLGRARAFENVIVATGHAMMGLSLGPVTGKLVGELLDDATPSIDLALLDPDRFA